MLEESKINKSFREQRFASLLKLTENTADEVVDNILRSKDSKEPIISLGPKDMSYSRAMIWHKRFLDIAFEVSTWSKDPSSQVGCVAINNRRYILGTGYNGFPYGIDDSPERLGNRELKYQFIIHAEENLICNTQSSLEGSTVYVRNIYPCNKCARLLIQVAIAEVVILADDALKMKNDWFNSWQLAESMFIEAGIKVTVV